MSILSDQIEQEIITNLGRHPTIVPGAPISFSLFNSFRIFNVTSINNEIAKLNIDIDVVPITIFIYSIDTQLELTLVGTFAQNINSLLLQFSISPGEYFIAFHSFSLTQITFSSIFTFNFDGVIFSDFNSRFGVETQQFEIELSDINELVDTAIYKMVAGTLPEGLLFRLDGIIEGNIKSIIMCDNVVEYEFYVLAQNSTEVIGGIFKLCVYNDWSIERDSVGDTGDLFSIKVVDIFSEKEELKEFENLCIQKSNQVVHDFTMESVCTKIDTQESELVFDISKNNCQVSQNIKLFDMSENNCDTIDKFPIFEFKNNKGICNVPDLETKEFDMKLTCHSDEVEIVDTSLPILSNETVDISDTIEFIADIFCLSDN